MRNFILIFLASLFLSGCVVGPLVVHETARTVGEGDSDLIGGYGTGGYVIKWNYGLLNDLDIGLQWESLSLGVRAKYAFINRRESGWSLAAAAGIGTSVGGNHYYGDLIGSYLHKAFEPYGTVRIVHVKTDPLEFKDKDTGNVDFTIDRYEYDYGQLILGTRFWFDKHWLLSVEASSLFSVSGGVKVGNGLLVGAAFGYRF